MFGKCYRQGEFLHGLAVVYESIYEIDRWWIGLTDLGTFYIFQRVEPINLSKFLVFVAYYFQPL